MNEIRFDPFKGIITCGYCVMKLSKPDKKTAKIAQSILDGKITESKLGNTWFCNQKISLTDDFLNITDCAVSYLPISGWSLSIPNNSEHKQIIKNIITYLALI